ncbi:unnamed protein product [Meloidogyne enterolobii]|uniref:Uncharacterized protein n=1 Tax=Meloidogyne enterolobii TaxID=390850 RepID=A0ACB1AB14_MELEN
MKEAFDKVQSVKETSMALYNKFNDKKYGKIHEKFKNAKLMDEEKLFDKNYLTGLFNKLWGHFTEKREVEGNVLEDAVSIWKSFALHFKIPSHNVCLCYKKKDVKKYSRLILKISKCKNRLHHSNNLVILLNSSVNIKHNGKINVIYCLILIITLKILIIFKRPQKSFKKFFLFTHQ